MFIWWKTNTFNHSLSLSFFFFLTLWLEIFRRVIYLFSASSCFFGFFLGCTDIWCMLLIPFFFLNVFHVYPLILYYSLYSNSFHFFLCCCCDYYYYYFNVNIKYDQTIEFRENIRFYVWCEYNFHFAMTSYERIIRCCAWVYVCVIYIQIHSSVSYTTYTHFFISFYKSLFFLLFILWRANTKILLPSSFRQVESHRVDIIIVKWLNLYKWIFLPYISWTVFRYLIEYSEFMFLFLLLQCWSKAQHLRHHLMMIMYNFL